MKCIAFGLLLVGCGGSEGIESERGASRRDPVVNGRVTFGDREIFAFRIAGALCSSTLIGRRTLLTAGHCVTDENNRVMSPAGSSVSNVVDISRWTQEIAVTAIRRHPDYTDLSTGALTNDVALLRLEREPPVPLKPWNRDSLPMSVVGGPVRLVGYGDVTGGSGFGLKRNGLSTLKNVLQSQIVVGAVGDLRANTCQGDSGGPALLTFGDGSERVVGITSFGERGCAATSASTDARVDAYVDFIGSTLDTYENGICGADARCRSGCVPVDPDCACVADARCETTCAAPSIDPDCSSACSADGVCSTDVAACATPDPDCQPVGSECGYEAHCSSRTCIASSQRPPYCTKACSRPADCPTAMTCEQSQCRHPLLPTVALGASCSPGQNLCVGDSVVCAAVETDPTLACRLACIEDADCGDGTCRSSPQTRGVCVANVMMKELGFENLVPSAGCQTAPGAGIIAATLAWLGRRRRLGRCAGVAGGSGGDIQAPPKWCR